VNATLFTVEQLAQLVSASEILRQEAMGEVMSPEARGYLQHRELKACFHRFACFGLGIEPGLEATVKTMDNAHFAKMVRGFGVEAGGYWDRAGGCCGCRGRAGWCGGCLGRAGYAAGLPLPAQGAMCSVPRVPACAFELSCPLRAGSMIALGRYSHQRRCSPGVSATARTNLCLAG
jgi:hypothetical protein